MHAGLTCHVKHPLAVPAVPLRAVPGALALPVRLVDHRLHYAAPSIDEPVGTEKSSCN